ncbi:hypothetical protein ERM42_10515 [Clostridioides difficile]|uniref:DUF6560 family protein n=1 Tax=Clostridioides difficile TaxID=1496 RepID=UPI0009461A76|nr:DUF6560 family protein [Clostridioides difficile]EGT3902777.1 hypothetical protein [Clostridioides difficile]EGT4948982.1 hypothetical protein [Clostridioides difficile]ELX4523750.1 hypothetical protein [Clostridioides difficile]MCO8786139.1 hypothetical protein [Clostridioides difficile]MCO8826137.1 hypothetical protein [Clostridioides difficile]
MKYLGTILVAYIVLFILDIMQKRNHKTTKSLNEFSIRTISDVSFICAIGALFLLGVLIWGFWSEPENFYSKRYLMIIIPFSIIWFGVTLFGMIAPLKGVWEIKVEGDNITVIKMFIFRRYWKISDISYCKMKRGGINVYVNGRKKKAFFVDGMTDHFDNFIKRIEKEGKEIIIPEPKDTN